MDKKMLDSETLCSTRELFVIVDKVAADIVGPVISARNDAEAMRLFTTMLNDQRTAIGTHPKDHVLIKIGYFELHIDNLTNVINSQQVMLDGATWLAMQKENTEE